MFKPILSILLRGRRRDIRGRVTEANYQWIEGAMLAARRALECEPVVWFVGNADTKLSQKAGFTDTGWSN